MKICFLTIFLLLKSFSIWAKSNDHRCKKAHTFALRNQVGELVSLEQLISSSKSKLIVLSFFQTTCPPCIEEIKYLQNLRKTKSLETPLFDLILVDSKEDRSVTFDFIKNNNLEKEIVLNDPYGKLDGLFNVRLIPKIVVLDRLGRIIESKEGKELSELREANKLSQLINTFGLSNPCNTKEGKN